MDSIENIVMRTGQKMSLLVIVIIVILFHQTKFVPCYRRAISFFIYLFCLGFIVVLKVVFLWSRRIVSALFHFIIIIIIIFLFRFAFLFICLSLFLF